MRADGNASYTRGARLAALCLLLTCTGQVRADDWVERTYDPSVGSRWSIDATQSSENVTGGSTQASTTTIKAELIFEQKLTDGFHVTYVTHDTTFEGDARTAAMIGPAAKALDNIPIRATLSANGTPLRVDNLDEVLAAAHTAVDRFTASLGGNPQVAAAAGKMVTGMLIADAQNAPRIYLATLLMLAVGQNTGLRPGETRNAVEDAANPLTGTPIKSNTTLRIDSADPATGNVRYIRTRTFDPDALKSLLGGVAQQMGGGNTELSQKLGEFLKQMSLTLDSRTEIAVEQGMTRGLEEEDTATTSGLGETIVKHIHKQVTVTRLTPP